MHRADGGFLLASSSLTGRFWDGSLWAFRNMEDYKQCPNLDMVATRTTSGISDAVWLPDGNKALLAMDSGELEVWVCKPPANYFECEAIMCSHDDMALCVTLLAGGDRAVSGGADGRVIVWSLGELSQVCDYLGHREAVLSVSPHPSCKDCFVSASRVGELRMWDLRREKPGCALTACSTSHPCAVCFSLRDENILAVGTETGAVDVVDMRQMSTTVVSYQPHTRAIHRLAFAPWNSALLASISDDTNTWVHDIKCNSKVLYSAFHTDFVRGLSWHPTQPHLLTCSWDGQVRQHLIEGKQIGKIDDLGSEGSVASEDMMVTAKPSSSLVERLSSD